MKILVELPTWLGDAVMATPALENLYKAYPEAEITLVGSAVSIDALRAHPRVHRWIVDRTKARGLRPLNLFRLAKELGPHDIALSFRSHFYSRLLLYLTKSRQTHTFIPAPAMHQVEKYQHFINSITGRDDMAGPLRLDWPVVTYNRPTLGINPGASYGSAKRWYPEKFAQVAAELSDEYQIVIFGGPQEQNIAKDIEKILKSHGIDNVANKAGKTTIPELCSTIGGLDLFLTNDSGPMHVAAAYGIPTVAIFGPTKDEETSQWKNDAGRIVRKAMECAPCMKRRCPLGHHACMKEIGAQEVLQAVKELPIRD